MFPKTLLYNGKRKKIFNGLAAPRPQSQGIGTRLGVLYLGIFVDLLETLAPPEDADKIIVLLLPIPIRIEPYCF